MGGIFEFWGGFFDCQMGESGSFGVYTMRLEVEVVIRRRAQTQLGIF